MVVTCCEHCRIHEYLSAALSSVTPISERVAYLEVPKPALVRPPSCARASQTQSSCVSIPSVKFDKLAYVETPSPPVPSARGFLFQSLLNLLLVSSAKVLGVGRKTAAKYGS